MQPEDEAVFILAIATCLCTVVVLYSLCWLVWLWSANVNV